MNRKLLIGSVLFLSGFLGICFSLLTYCLSFLVVNEFLPILIALFFLFSITILCVGIFQFSEETPKVDDDEDSLE